MGRGSADYVLHQLGLVPVEERDEIVRYESEFNPYERVVVDFGSNDGNVRLDDFREILLNEGFDCAAVDAAIEQLPV